MTAQPISTKRAPMSSAGVDVRREKDGSRWYADPTDDTLYASVTTAISMTTSMPWLTPWAAGLAAEAAVDEHQLIASMLASRAEDEDLTPEQLKAATVERRAGAVAYLKTIAKKRRDAASEDGTWVHDVVQALILDTPLPEFRTAESQESALAFMDWCIEWEPEFWMSECTVADPRRGYAGTLDIGCWIPCLGKSYLIDVKSGKNLSAYMPVQLSAYRRATEVWLPLGKKARMLEFDACAVLHVRPGGAKLIEVEAGDEEFNTFLRMLEQIDWHDRQPKQMGRVLYIPDEFGNQPPPLLEDLELVPARSALAAAGIYRLDHLADADPQALLDLKGFGPGALRGTRLLLSKHGMDMDGLDDTIARLDAEDAAKVARKAAKEAKALTLVEAMPDEDRAALAAALQTEPWDAS